MNFEVRRPLKQGPLGSEHTLECREPTPGRRRALLFQLGEGEFG